MRDYIYANVSDNCVATVVRPCVSGDPHPRLVRGRSSTPNRVTSAQYFRTRSKVKVPYPMKKTEVQIARLKDPVLYYVYIYSIPSQEAGNVTLEWRVSMGGGDDLLSGGSVGPLEVL
ncbi:hypothetical protein EVAR_15978_1 [Eumeta japonica]|uniref:Uncharacterized protein n=1 Tax=Eumeta variegata TaxID=151549 RepID=A0A4C1ULA7_EUMVA|nr:hypothetical protein EVAR_15978_1 [Eumeta japonica]